MSRVKKVFISIIVIIILIAVGAYIFREGIISRFFEPTDSTIEEGSIKSDEETVRIVSTNLQTPWAIAFMPNGDMLVTERPGTLKRISENSQTYEVAGVTETSEGGLLGIALHPEYEENKFLYLYSTYRGGSGLLNRVERYTFHNDKLENGMVIIENIPGSSTHDGGAIAFGPDGKLYITTGDANNQTGAQDTSLLSGKILRINDNGTIPDDNPFSNAVYSYGHRNPQGITWDDKGRLWSTEHGPSGTSSGRDELNLIEKGQNYGWPEITGDETREGMRSPVVQSGNSETWAPGGITHKDGVLYFTGLRGQSIYQATIIEGTEPKVSLLRFFTGEYGRLRGITVQDGGLFISTSNTDGRGSPRDDDDKILRINPNNLSQ